MWFSAELANDKLTQINSSNFLLPLSILNKRVQTPPDPNIRNEHPLDKVQDFLYRVTPVNQKIVENRCTKRSHRRFIFFFYHWISHENSFTDKIGKVQTITNESHPRQKVRQAQHLHHSRHYKNTFEILRYRSVFSTFLFQQLHLIFNINISGTILVVLLVLFLKQFLRVRLNHWDRSDQIFILFDLTWSDLFYLFENHDRISLPIYFQFNCRLS